MAGLDCKKAVVWGLHCWGCKLAGNLLVPVVMKKKFAVLKGSSAVLGGTQTGVVAQGLHHKAAVGWDTAAGIAAAAVGIVAAAAEGTAAAAEGTAAAAEGTAAAAPCSCSAAAEPWAVRLDLCRC